MFYLDNYISREALEKKFNLSILKFYRTGYLNLLYEYFTILVYFDVMEATVDERRATWNWIRNGGSINDNPDGTTIYSGMPLDFISNLRFVKDMEDYNSEFNQI